LERALAPALPQLLLRRTRDVGGAT
jgi:hypothetical protein